MLVRRCESWGFVLHGRHVTRARRRKPRRLPTTERVIRFLASEQGKTVQRDIGDVIGDVVRGILGTVPDVTTLRARAGTALYIAGLDGFGPPATDASPGPCQSCIVSLAYADELRVALADLVRAIDESTFRVHDYQEALKKARAVLAEDARARRG